MARRQIIFYIRRVDIVDLLQNKLFIPNYQYMQVGKEFSELGTFDGIPVKSLDKAPGRKDI